MSGGMIAQGMCGEELSWTLDEQGTLLVQGEGEMASSDWDPWFTEKAEQVRRLVIQPGADNVGQNCFEGFTNLEEVSLPEGLISIDENAFADCSALKRINLPVSLERIGASAFSRCKALTELTLPDGLLFLEGSVFQDCASLKRITLPSGLAGAGENLFVGCNALEQVILPPALMGEAWRLFFPRDLGDDRFETPRAKVEITCSDPAHQGDSLFAGAYGRQFVENLRDLYFLLKIRPFAPDVDWFGPAIDLLEAGAKTGEPAMQAQYERYLGHEVDMPLPSEAELGEQLLRGLDSAAKHAEWAEEDYTRLIDFPDGERGFPNPDSEELRRRELALEQFLYELGWRNN